MVGDGFSRYFARSWRAGHAVLICEATRQKGARLSTVRLTIPAPGRARSSSYRWKRADPRALLSFCGTRGGRIKAYYFGLEPEDVEQVAYYVQLLCDLSFKRRHPFPLLLYRHYSVFKTGRQALTRYKVVGLPLRQAATSASTLPCAVLCLQLTALCPSSATSKLVLYTPSTTDCLVRFDNPSLLATVSGCRQAHCASKVVPKAHADKGIGLTVQCGAKFQRRAPQSGDIDRRAALPCVQHGELRLQGRVPAVATPCSTENLGLHVEHW